VCSNRFFPGMVLETDVQAYRSNMEDVNGIGKERKVEVTCSWFGI